MRQQVASKEHPLDERDGEVLNAFTGDRRMATFRFVTNDPTTVERANPEVMTGYLLARDGGDWKREYEQEAALEAMLADGVRLAVSLTNPSGAFTADASSDRHTSFQYSPPARSQRGTHSVEVRMRHSWKLLARGAGENDSAALLDAWHSQVRQQGPAWLIRSIGNSYLSAVGSDPAPLPAVEWRCAECGTVVDAHPARSCLDRLVDRALGRDTNLLAGESTRCFSTDIDLAQRLADERIWPAGWQVSSTRPGWMVRTSEGEEIVRGDTLELAIARAAVKRQPGGSNVLELRVPPKPLRI